MTSLTALLLTLLLALGGVAFSDGNVESPSLSDEEVITCEHEFMETFEYENGRSEFIPLNDWEHVFNAYAPAWEQCAKCGLKRSVGEKLYYTETNKHAFADGVCTDCGAASVCPHDMKVLLYARDSYTPYEQIDAATPPRHLYPPRRTTAACAAERNGLRIPCSPRRLCRPRNISFPKAVTADGSATPAATFPNARTKTRWKCTGGRRTSASIPLWTATPIWSPERASGMRNAPTAASG